MGVSAKLTFNEGTEITVEGFYSDEWKQMSTLGHPASARPTFSEDIAGLYERADEDSGTSGSGTYDYIKTRNEDGSVSLEVTGLTALENTVLVGMKKLRDHSANPLFIEMPGCGEHTRVYDPGYGTPTTYTILSNDGIKLPIKSSAAAFDNSSGQIPNDGLDTTQFVIDDGKVYLVDILNFKYKYVCELASLLEETRLFKGYGNCSPLYADPTDASTSGDWTSFSRPTEYSYPVHPWCYAIDPNLGVAFIEGGTIHVLNPVSGSISHLPLDSSAQQWASMATLQVSQWTANPTVDLKTALNQGFMCITTSGAQYYPAGCTAMILVDSTDNVSVLECASDTQSSGGAEIIFNSDFTYDLAARYGYLNGNEQVRFQSLRVWGSPIFLSLGNGFYLCRGIYAPYSALKATAGNGGISYIMPGYSIMHTYTGNPLAYIDLSDVSMPSEATSYTLEITLS